MGASQSKIEDVGAEFDRAVETRDVEMMRKCVALDSSVVTRKVINMYQCFTWCDTHACADLIPHSPLRPRLQDAGGFTPLHTLARIGDSEALRYLLSCTHVGINEPNNFGWTPLHSAVIYEELTSVRILIEHGANPNVRHDGGMTPLHCAMGDADDVRNDVISKQRKMEIMTFLLAEGADRWSRCTYDEVAARNGFLPGQTPLHRACFLHKIDMVRALLTVGITDKSEIDWFEVERDSEYSCLHLAVDFDLVARLREENVLAGHSADDHRRDVTYHGYTYFHEAKEIVKLLLDAGAPANKATKKHVTPLLLLQSKPGWKEHNNKALVEEVEKLLAGKVGSRTKDARNRTKKAK